MTREQMAQAVQDAARIADYDGAVTVGETLHAAVVELRKSCATCKHFRSHTDNRNCTFLGVVAYSDDDLRLPADGSGYCRPGWEAK